MATNINYPDNPRIGNTDVEGDVTYKYDGPRWGIFETNYVSYDELGIDLKAKVALPALEIDWEAGVEFTKTIAATSTFTDANLVENKLILLHLTGDYSPSFPAYWDIMKGSEDYDGTVNNRITIHCIESASGSEEVLYSINQKDV